MAAIINPIAVEMRRFSRCISCAVAKSRSRYYCGVEQQWWDVGRPGEGSVYSGIGFVRREHSLSRDWFKGLWAADKKDDRIKDIDRMKEFRGSNWSPFSRRVDDGQGGFGRMSNDGFRYNASVNTTSVEQKSGRQYESPTLIEEASYSFNFR